MALKQKLCEEIANEKTKPNWFNALELASWATAIPPVGAAIGMLAGNLLYTSLTNNSPEAWGQDASYQWMSALYGTLCSWANFAAVWWASYHFYDSPPRWEE